MSAVDLKLQELMRERLRLQKELAPVLTRVGGNHPKRKSVNAKRAAVRQQLRRALRANAEQMVAHVMATYGVHIG